MTKKNQSIRRTYLTPAFRLSYPVLFEPQPDLSNRLRFSCTMLFPKAELVAKMKRENHPAAPFLAADNGKGFWNEIVSVARANFGPEVNLAGLKMVNFRDGDQPKSTTGQIEETAKGYVVVRTTSKDAPDLRRQDKVRITDPGEMYAGCWVRAVLTISPFYQPQHGVTTYLVGLQKLADDDAFSGRPRVDDVFDEVALDEVSSPIEGTAGAANPMAGQPTMPWE